MINLNEIKSNYPQTISKEDLYKILHISKRKATWLLENKYIPYQKNSKGTWKYKIKLDDVITFIENCMHNSDKHNSKQKEFSISLSLSTILFDSDDFKLWLSDEWALEKDIMINTDIVTLTGYTISTVNQWLLSCKLQNVKTQSGIFTTKDWLINFYCNDGNRIVNKCVVHCKLLNKYNMS